MTKHRDDDIRLRVPPRVINRRDSAPWRELSAHDHLLGTSGPDPRYHLPTTTTRSRWYSEYQWARVVCDSTAEAVAEAASHIRSPAS